jgi:competence protein ComEC
MLAAIPIMLAAPRPDVVIEAGGEVVAVRGVDGRYSIVNPKADRFTAEYWLRADADSRGLDEDVSAGVACDAVGCVTHLADGTRVAVGQTPEAFEDDCRLSDVVISRYRAPAWCRDSATTVVDRSALAVGGAHALYAVSEATAGSPRFRIETAYPPGPRRPFMPPAQ